MGVPGDAVNNKHELLVNRGADSIDLKFHLNEPNPFRSTSSTDDNTTKPRAAFFIDENWGKELGCITHAMQGRTTAENASWSRHLAQTEPSYSELCITEYEEIIVHVKYLRTNCCGDRAGSSIGNVIEALIKCIIALLCFCCVGHIVTKSGIRACRIMVWKFYAYVGICFGFWTDELVEMFEIHQHVRTFTCAYLDPHVKRKMFLRANGVYLEEQNDFLTSTEEFERTQRDIKEICGPIAKKTLKDDYASCLHALLAPRATLAQLIPFGAFLTIYVSNTARYPCFSSSEQLNESLFPLIIKDPFDDCREDDQTYLDELYEIRKAEVHIDSRDIIEGEGDDQDPKRLERVWF